MKTWRSILSFGTVLTIFCCLWQWDCSRNSATTKQQPPIIIIGLDGAEWDIVLWLLEQGRLPTIRDLMLSGSYGMLNTHRPSLSPILWTTIGTGKTPQKHGIKGFVRVKPDGSQSGLYTNSDRKTKAFWNIFSDYKRSVYCIGWFLTFPVEPINGVMVAQTNSLKLNEIQDSSHPGIQGQIYPPERQQELMDVIADADRETSALIQNLIQNQKPHPATTDKLERIRWAFRADTIYEKIALKLLQSGKVPDVTAIYFGGIDSVSHMFWHFMERRPKDPLSGFSETEIRNAAEIIPRYYDHIDKRIQNLLQQYPREKTVIIVSDHGHTYSGHTNGPPAFLVAAGSGIRKMSSTDPSQLKRSDLQTIGSILDITPTLLEIANLPLGLDMQGRVLKQLIEPSFLARKRTEPVPTHDTAQWQASRPKLAPGNEIDPERLEQLRALGYIN